MQNYRTYRCDLTLSADKFSPNLPDLTGFITVESVSYRIGLWDKLTRDGTRSYFSGSLQLANDRTAPRLRLKLFEFRKLEASDPDYYGPEPLTIEDFRGFPYLWTRSQDPEAGEELRIVFALSDCVRRQKLSESALELRERLLARASSHGLPSERDSHPGQPEPSF